MFDKKGPVTSMVTYGEGDQGLWAPKRCGRPYERMVRACVVQTALMGHLLREIPGTPAEDGDRETGPVSGWGRLGVIT